jgi:hypothetical protein
MQAEHIGGFSKLDPEPKCSNNMLLTVACLSDMDNDDESIQQP